MKLSFTHWFPNPTKVTVPIVFFLSCFFFIGKGLAQNCPPPSAIQIDTDSITDTSAQVTWNLVSSADYYLVEYGPQGFPLGSGITDTTSIDTLVLDSLNPCVAYDVYLFSVCGNTISLPAGPETFMTTSPHPTCAYTFVLEDNFGDGWNNAFLSVLHNGEETILTVDYSAGFGATFELPFFSGLPVCISYTPGFFENEVSYNILDPNGNSIFADGPDPAVGNIFNFVACDACAAPKEWIMSDVNATNATTSWSFLPGSTTGSAFLEYGPLGFTRGTGTKVNVPTGQSSFNMTGLQEKTWYNVYLGVDCGQDSSKVIGPLQFETLWLVDVGVSLIIPNADEFCNLGSDETITVGLTNFGQSPQTLFDFFYSVNGVDVSIPMPQDGFFTGVVGNDSTQILQFETTFDFSQPGLYVIEAWTALEGDSDISNDTFRVEFLNSFPNPVKEDFEDLAIPADWTTDQFFTVYAANSHNNPTAVFGVNVFESNPDFHLTTGRIGPVSIGDTLSFDYRFVDWFDGVDSTLLSGGDSLIVQISDDCEKTYETVLVIDSVSHVSTTAFTNKFVLLDDYDGRTINVRFLAKWGDGDYWVDLDNINIQGVCPASFGPIVEIDGAFENDTNGVATITPIGGTGPYTFDWSTNESQTGDVGILENIGPGPYFVDITDANGCMETIIFEVGTLVASDEIYGVEEISLYPNPTTGLVNLDIELSSNMDVQARIMDMSGRIISQVEYLNALSMKQQFDLYNQPSGLYIVQVVANGKPYYAKVMVAR
ncbi:MAG: T9SS type A sorting domain-containing protein [Saprospiraceae bacterium]